MSCSPAPAAPAAPTKVLDRIAALLALAEGNTNENEAAAAMAAANRLMAQHQIDRASIDAHAATPEDEDVDIGDTVLDALGGVVVATWRWQLAQGIAVVHGCSCYQQDFYDAETKSRRARLMILGTATDAGAARYIYAYAARQIEALTADALEHNGRPGRSWATNFRQGCAQRVVSRYREANKRNVAEVRATASATALVRVDAARETKELALRAAVKAKKLRSVGGSTSRYDEHARSAGRAAGDRVDLGGGSSRGSLGAGSPRLGS